MRISDWSSDVCSSDLWNAFVCRPEQHVVFDARGRQSLCVRGTQCAHRHTGRNLAKVEEVRRLAPGLEREFAELQHFMLQGQLQEFGLIIGQGHGTSDRGKQEFAYRYDKASSTSSGEIGQESGRERVCRIGEFSVVSG